MPIEGRDEWLPSFRHVVVGVDPAATSGEGAIETGIVAGASGMHEHFYVLEVDAARMTPAE